MTEYALFKRTFIHIPGYHLIRLLLLNDLLRQPDGDERSVREDYLVFSRTNFLKSSL